MFLGLFIPSSPLVTETLIQTNSTNDVLPISSVHSPGLHILDVSMRWICLPLFGLEPWD